MIGNNTGNGEKVVTSYIKERLVTSNNRNTGDKIEIANHSWYHEHFLTLNVDQQSNSIRKTNERIENIFGITPTILFPPYNEFNNDTILAAHENNMRYISSDLEITKYIQANPILQVTIFRKRLQQGIVQIAIMIIVTPLGMGCHMKKH